VDYIIVFFRLVIDQGDHGIPLLYGAYSELNPSFTAEKSGIISDLIRFDKIFGILPDKFHAYIGEVYSFIVFDIGSPDLFVKMVYHVR